MTNFLSNLGSGLSGFAAGIEDPSLAYKMKQNIELGNIMSGNTIPAFARAGGAEPQSAESIRQIQLAQLAKLGTPAATAMLTNLSPLSQRPLTDLERQKAQADIAKTQAETKYYGAGGASPAAVREYKEFKALSPQEQEDYMKLKRADPYAKPLPAPIVQAQDALVSEIGAHKGISTNLGEFENKIDKGTLKLDVIGNIQNKVKNNLSISDTESRNLASFESYLNKLRNDTLALQKGTQTEDDAKRAWDELIKNISDPQVVKQRLGEIKVYNNVQTQLKQNRIKTMRSEYKKGDLPETPSVPSQFEEKIPDGGAVAPNAINASEYFK